MAGAGPNEGKPMDEAKLSTTTAGNTPGRRAAGRGARRRARRAVVPALGAMALAGGAAIAGAPAALASSTAPTHGTTTCAVAGDECTNAVAYANANDGGGAKVLAVEADTETHGGSATHRVFDIRMKTNNGIYNIHVYRNDNAPYGDAVWWQKLAENQNPSSGSVQSGGSGGAPGSPDHGSGGSPDHGSGGSGASSTMDSPQITASQAASDATSFATTHGMQVLGVKHEQVNSNGQKDYYQVKLQLGSNGQRHGTTNVWVDATTSPGTVTAGSGSGLDYRDTSVVSPAAAQASAVTAAGGGTAYKVSLHGGKWRWYWVFVQNGSTKDKVGVDAVTGVVTQVRQS